jgi:hypothetical protein
VFTYIYGGCFTVQLRDAELPLSGNNAEKHFSAALVRFRFNGSAVGE